MFTSQSFHLIRSLSLAGAVFSLCLAGCGASVMSLSARKTSDISHYDAIVNDLQREPVAVVHHDEILQQADYLEQREQSLATLTPEMVGEKIQMLWLKLRGLTPDEEAATVAFAEGVELFDAGKFKESREKFYVAEKRWPDSPLAEDAIFMNGEAAFFDKRYADAQKKYEWLLKKYDSTRYLDRVSGRLFAIGQYWDKKDQADHKTVNFSDKTRPWTGTFTNCIKAYQTIALHDSRGQWADCALMAAGTASYIRGQYVKASLFYDQLIKDYPQSRYFLQACELNLSAKLLMYEGPSYDGKPLEDADEIAERLSRQFAAQLTAEKKKNLTDTRMEIVEAKAERDMMFARFYESKRCYGAASYYYLLVMDEFPGTRAASKAKERYAQVKDLRPEPPDYFAWLKVIFPER